MDFWIKEIFRVTKRFYYVSYLVGLVSLLSGFALSRYYCFDRMDPVFIQIQSMDIILLLGSLPGILWLFHKKTKELGGLPTMEQRTQRYLRWSLIRLIVIDFNLVINILLLFLLRDISYLFATAIVMVMLILSRPIVQKLKEELGLVKETEILPSEDQDGQGED
ncbi:hypothetical protein [Microbacter margulisiae]|uniref:Uncharacterized protein n=1 Tax=Microbacter margulisiae TaxID=1350067 RepID=A0A7W5H141_9PORP|nr:hypothetical protein [Microbacter margulisiae]MBB3185946.1 hypothetical protein [Microbacter margulisiae]